MQTFTKQIGNLILVCLNKKVNFKFKFEFITLLLKANMQCISNLSLMFIFFFVANQNFKACNLTLVEKF